MLDLKAQPSWRTLLILCPWAPVQEQHKYSSRLMTVWYLMFSLWWDNHILGDEWLTTRCVCFLSVAVACKCLRFGVADIFRARRIQRHFHFIYLFKRIVRREKKKSRETVTTRILGSSVVDQLCLLAALLSGDGEERNVGVSVKTSSQKAGMRVHICNPGTGEVDAGRLGVQAHL